MPSKLYLAMVDGLEFEAQTEVHARMPGPKPFRPQPHSVAMRFLDCLFDRCRAPLSSDLEEKPGPDMLCCGSLVEVGKSYCTYHETRLCDRRHEYRAEAA
jgi:GcrA cell cycle regulator